MWFHQVTKKHATIRGDELAHYGEQAVHPHLDTTDYFVALCSDDRTMWKGVPAWVNQNGQPSRKCPYCSRRLRGHLKRKNKAAVKDLLAMKEEIE